MQPQSPGSDLPSASALRASLLGPPAAGGDELDRWLQLPQSVAYPSSSQRAAASSPAAAARVAPAAPASSAPGPASAPSAEEVLGSSPAVVRLCESYHRALATMLQRSRRQRIGIFCLVAGLSVGATLLSRSGTLTAELVSDLVLAAAGSSAASLALLAMLWMRDQRRLRAVQGQRLLRALQSSCTLAPERLGVLRSSREPVSTFFDCYSLWRSHHRAPQSRLATVIATFRGTNRPSAA